MADKTKADLEEEVKALRKEYDEVRKENQLMREAGGMDLSTWHTKITDQADEIERLKSEVKLRDERMNEWKHEQAAKEHDAKHKHEQETRPFQTEHTRFRLLPGPYLRDIFGNVGTPVFDLGVTLDHYSGHVDIPLPVVIEMAESIGMLSVEKSDELKAELETEKAKNEAAAKLGSILAGGINQLVDGFHDGLSTVGVSSDPEGQDDNGTDEVPVDDSGLDDSEASGTDNESDPAVADDGEDDFDLDSLNLDKL